MCMAVLHWSAPDFLAPGEKVYLLTAGASDVVEDDSVAVDVLDI